MDFKRALLLAIISLLIGGVSALFAQSHDGHDHDDHATHDSNNHNQGDCFGEDHGEEEFNPSATALHHISDANAFHIFGDLYMPLPCILYSPEDGWNIFLSSKFEFGHHGNGKKAVNKYVLYEGIVKRVDDANFPMGVVDVHGFGHSDHGTLVGYQGNCYSADDKSTLDGGMLGGGITSFYDFSITKNVFTMLMVAFFLGWVFISCARAYKRRAGKAPKGMQNFMEPLFIFIQDEVAKPFLGNKYEKFMPFLLSIFFFILGLNLIGQIPFFPGSANVTGNISVTIILALVTFFIVNLNGNKHYWQHIFWMPGIPWAVKLILTPIEVLGVFLKPFTLLVRLFANITAGHIVILSFVGLIFLLGESGRNVSGAIGGIIGSTVMTLFMSCIELLVAFIQAFIFTILSASYLGAAIEEHH